MLSFAFNTAQKIHNITGEMTKLGALKNEETKPIWASGDCLQSIENITVTPSSGKIMSFRFCPILRRFPRSRQSRRIEGNRQERMASDLGI
jgi:hypothetical protein